MGAPNWFQADAFVNEMRSRFILDPSSAVTAETPQKPQQAHD